MWNNFLNFQDTKAKFVFVGIWNTIFGYAVFVVLNGLFTCIFTKRYYEYLLALIVANVIAVINAFVFHKYITFRSQSTGKDLLREFLRFFSTYILVIAVGFLTLPILVEIAGLDPNISGLILVPITTVISYLGHSYFSFKI